MTYATLKAVFVPLQFRTKNYKKAFIVIFCQLFPVLSTLSSVFLNRMFHNKLVLLSFICFLLLHTFVVKLKNITIENSQDKQKYLDAVGTLKLYWLLNYKIKIYTAKVLPEITDFQQINLLMCYEWRPIHHC